MNRPSFIHFIGALVLVLVLMVGYLVWFFTVSGVRADASHAASEVVRIEREDAAIVDAKETITALASDEAKLRSYFIAKSDTVAFLEELEQESEALGTSLEVLSVTEPVVENGRLTLALRIEGTFSSVMRTLGAIEFGPHDTRVDSLTLDTPVYEEGGEAPWVAAAMISVATTNDDL